MGKVRAYATRRDALGGAAGNCRDRDRHSQSIMPRSPRCGTVGASRAPCSAPLFSCHGRAARIAHPTRTMPLSRLVVVGADAPVVAERFYVSFYPCDVALWRPVALCALRGVPDGDEQVI